MHEYLLGRRVSGRVTAVGFHCDVISWRGADEASGSGELQRVFTGKGEGGGILCSCDFSPGKTATVCDAAVCGTGTPRPCAFTPAVATCTATDDDKRAFT